MSNSKHHLNVYQDDKKRVYFKSDMNKFYYITDYKWVGPEYQNVEVGGGQTEEVSTSHGGLGPAIIGGVIGGPVGALIGYGNGRHTDTEVVSGTPPHEETQEVDTPASLTFTPIDGGKPITVEFNCNTDINKQILSMDLSHIPAPKSQTAPAQPDLVSEMEQYKKLLDDKIITQEEYDKKKKEILGL